MTGEVASSLPDGAASDSEMRQCRVCGQIDVTHFCLICLADTMSDAP